MQQDVVSFLLASENRKKIARTLFEYPNRQWSCSALEELSKISHATVFRTLSGLKEFGILKSFKINKKDIVYELSKNPIIEDIKRILEIDKLTYKKIAKNFVNAIKSEKIYSVILYGSGIKGEIKPESDVDILIIIVKHNREFERKLFDKAAVYSSEVNKTLSLVIMDKLEIKKEKNSQFLKSIKKNYEVIHGKEPF